MMNINNTYKAQKRSKIGISVLIILVVIYLLGVVSYDAFITTPEKNKQIEIVHNKFSEMKTYLDAKLPEIDSALTKHEIQLNIQNEQLRELNELTIVIKEGQ